VTTDQLGSLWRRSSNKPGRQSRRTGRRETSGMLI